MECGVLLLLLLSEAAPVPLQGLARVPHPALLPPHLVPSGTLFVALTLFSLQPAAARDPPASIRGRELAWDTAVACGGVRSAAWADPGRGRGRGRGGPAASSAARALWPFAAAFEEPTQDRCPVPPHPSPGLHGSVPRGPWPSQHVECVCFSAWRAGSRCQALACWRGGTWWLILHLDLELRVLCVPSGRSERAVP